MPIYMSDFCYHIVQLGNKLYSSHNYHASELNLDVQNIGDCSHYTNPFFQVASLEVNMLFSYVLPSC